MEIRKYLEKNQMKKPIFAATRSAFLVAAILCVNFSLRADVVYANTNNDLTARFNPGLIEVGDEIVLAGGARTVTDFNFEYWGLNFSGNEFARIRFYANDGAASPAGPLLPNSLLFDSGFFFILPTPRAVLDFNSAALTSGNVLNLTGPVPNSFTWSVQFSGITAGESAGLDLYNPPTIGGNYDDYWDNNGGWQYRFRGTNATPISFGASVSAVPEPAILGLGLLGGLAVLLVRNRFQRR